MIIHNGFTAFITGMHREKIYGSAEISAEKRKYSNFLLQKIFICVFILIKMLASVYYASV